MKEELYKRELDENILFLKKGTRPSNRAFERLDRAAHPTLEFIKTIDPNISYKEKITLLLEWLQNKGEEYEKNHLVMGNFYFQQRDMINIAVRRIESTEERPSLIPIGKTCKRQVILENNKHTPYKFRTEDGLTLYWMKSSKKPFDMQEGETGMISFIPEYEITTNKFSYHKIYLVDASGKEFAIQRVKKIEMN